MTPILLILFASIHKLTLLNADQLKSAIGAAYIRQALSPQLQHCTETSQSWSTGFGCRVVVVFQSVAEPLTRATSLPAAAVVTPLNSHSWQGVHLWLISPLRLLLWSLVKKAGKARG